MGGIGASVLTISPGRPLRASVTTFGALVGSGFRRYATYRQATIAGSFTNIVFGFLRCYVLLAVAAGAPGFGDVVGTGVAVFVPNGCPAGPPGCVPPSNVRAIAPPVRSTWRWK